MGKLYVLESRMESGTRVKGRGMKKEDDGLCGIAPFTLPPDHPFREGCRNHDRLYLDYLRNFPTRSLGDADKMFLSYMLGVAREKGSIVLKMQAYAFYSLITAFRLVARTPTGKPPMPPE